MPAQMAYLPGIGGGGDVTLPLTSMKGARTRTTLIQKYDFSCGSAAVATLLTHHYDFPVTEATVFQEMYETGDQQKIHREGFSLLDMKRFLDARGFVADGFEQPLDKLREARVPAIVLINENGYHHFVVVKGVEDERVLIGDPAQGTRVMPRHIFESKWKNGLLFVIHNRMDIAKFNVASEWRVTPRSPLDTGISRGSMSDITMPRMGPGEF
ncbi:C39 family peptidase [Variovorax sp. J22R133]|uniref:C39 family peptidase n=1 Tax=Variovorax brevis TaxID=3053503 RepID=UPI0025762B59|nr:C39 family peptidase [Variovorax sp. J22R133]MDM0112575.1 C39 family peptidase [Variovorax sp. J22R133]